MKRQWTYFKKLFLPILIAGTAVQPLFSFNVPLSTFLHAALTDWQGPSNLEKVLPFIPAIASDIRTLQGKPIESFTISTLSAGVRTALQAQLLLFKSYQEGTYGSEDLADAQLETDIRNGLMIFCGYTRTAAAAMPIKIISDTLEHVRQSSFGILATNKVIFVDQEFLNEWRQKDFLMYSFFIGYGLMHLKQHTFLKRNVARLTNTFTQSLASSTISRFLLKSVELGAAKLSWTALGDAAGDVNRGWIYSFLLFSARLTSAITCSVVAEMATQPLSQKFNEWVYQATEHVNKEMFLERMDRWLKHYVSKADLSKNHTLTCPQHRLLYIGQKLKTWLVTLDSNSHAIRRWFIVKAGTHLKKIYLTIEKCSKKSDIKNLNNHNQE